MSHSQGRWHRGRGWRSHRHSCKTSPVKKNLFCSMHFSHWIPFFSAFSWLFGSIWKEWAFFCMIQCKNNFSWLFVCLFICVPSYPLSWFPLEKKKKVRKEKESNTSAWNKREESVWEMSNGAENPWTFSRNPHPLEQWIQSVYQNTLWCIAVREWSRPSIGKGS